jgi:hypothetical protein
LVLATELLGIGQVPVGLSAASGQVVAVNYTVTAGTAEAGNDYFLSDGTLSIPVGSTLSNIVPVIVDDVLTEGGETFTITITSATGANLGTRLTVTVLISDNDNIGFTGPGGVGDALTNRFWLSADQIALNSLDPVLHWPDRSGNNSVVTSIGTGNPRFLQSSIGGRPAVEFVAANQNFFRLPSLGSLAQGEVFTVLATNNDPPATTARSGLWHLGVDAVGHYPLTNGNLYESFGTTTRKDNLPIALLNQPRIYGVRSLPSFWEARLDGAVVNSTATNAVAFPTQPNLGGGPATPTAYFDGRMSEVIFYNQVLNSAQRLIVENYLAAKYQITIPVASDYYAFEVAHGSEVAGIGRLSSTSLHVKARSGSFLDIGSPTNLGDNEFLLFGHNNGSVAAWTATGAPNAAFQRLAREWRVSETGDVGSVIVSFNTSTWPARPAGFDNYVIIVDDDGNLTSGYTLLTPTFTSATTFDVSVNLAHGQYVVVGVSQNITRQNGNFSDPATWLSGIVPQANQEVIVEHDVQLTSATTVAGMQIRTGAGQLRLGANTLTVSSGNLSLSSGGQLVPGTGTVSYDASGSQCIAPATYYNLSLGGAGIKTLCGAIEVTRNLTYLNPVALATANFNITLGGSWLGSGTFTAGSASVTFNGTGTQQIATPGLIFNNVTINKTTGDVQLLTPITVNSTLNLTRGDLILGSFNVVLAAGASVTGGSALAYVQTNGAGQIVQNVSATGARSFPVGDASVYTPVSVNLTSATFAAGAQLRVRVVNGIEPNITNVAISRYWIVQQSGITTPVYTINYRYDDSDLDILGTDEATWQPARWNGTSILKGTVDDLDDATNTINWAGLTSFSEFSVASPTPLPIELKEFVGRHLGEVNLLSWVTLSELNNERFDLQRSADGAEFETIGQIAGKGTTNRTSRYEFIDYYPVAGANYYRLRQVDFDQKSAYSGVIVVYTDESDLMVTITPNPVKAAGQITISGPVADGNASLDVCDLMGRVIHTVRLSSATSRQPITLDTKGMADGIYLLRLKSDGVVRIHRFMVAKE